MVEMSDVDRILGLYMIISFIICSGGDRIRGRTDSEALVPIDLNQPQVAAAIIGGFAGAVVSLVALAITQVSA